MILYFWFCKFIGYSCKCYYTSWPNFVHIQVYYKKWRQKSKFQKQGQISVTGYQPFNWIFIHSVEFLIVIVRGLLFDGNIDDSAIIGFCHRKDNYQHQHTDQKQFVLPHSYFSYIEKQQHILTDWWFVSTSWGKTHMRVIQVNWQ